MNKKILLFSLLTLFIVPISASAENRFQHFNSNNRGGHNNFPKPRVQNCNHNQVRQNPAWIHQGQVDSDGILSPGEIANPLINYNRYRNPYAENAHHHDFDDRDNYPGNRNPFQNGWGVNGRR